MSGVRPPSQDGVDVARRHADAVRIVAAQVGLDQVGGDLRGLELGGAGGADDGGDGRGQVGGGEDEGIGHGMDAVGAVDRVRSGKVFGKVAQ